MDRKHLHELRAWFDEYVAGFYGDNDLVNVNVKIKEDHTRRTCREILYICDKLGLPSQQKRLAEAIALFHDIGRFEQFVRFRTYNDAVSIRHASLGAQILRQEQVLGALDEQQQELVIRAVEHHAEKHLPQDLDGPCLLFAKLIRDADKLDIYRVVLRHYQRYKDNPYDSTLGLGLPDHPECSSHVVEKMLCRKYIDYRELRTLNDLKLMQLGWVYDVNFTASLERIREGRFLETLAALIPSTTDTETIKRTALSYLDDRIGKEADIQPF